MQRKPLISTLLTAILSTGTANAQTPTTTSLSGPIWLTQKQLDDWNLLKQDMDARVPSGFEDCNGEIDAAYVQVSEQYSSKGLSDDFFAALNYVQLVAGDVDEYSQFRSQFSNISTSFRTYYNQTVNQRMVDLAKAQAASVAYAASASASAAQKTALAAAPSHTAAVYVQATDAPHAYGVVSATAHTGISAASLLLALFASSFSSSKLQMTKVKELEAKIEAMISKLKKFQETKKYSAKEIELVQEELHGIDEQYNDGAIHEADGSISAGQAEFSDYLNEAHEMIADLLAELPDDE